MKTYIAPQTTTTLLIEPIMSSVGTSVTKIVSGTGPIVALGQMYRDIKDAL